MDVWSCCQCGAPNLIATAPACPICTHPKCKDCQRGPPPQELGSPHPLFPPQQHRLGHSYYISSPSNDTHYRLASPTSYNSPSTPSRHSSAVTTANTRRPLPTRGPSYGAYNTIQGSQYALQQSRRGVPPGSDGHNVQMYTPPPGAGWWRCCLNGHINNPGSNPERCRNDNHAKCGSCHFY